MSSAAEQPSPIELERRARDRSSSEEQLEQSLSLALVGAWAPPPDETVTEWADRHRQLSPESSAEPGQYSSARTPWVREIQDAANDPDVREIVACTASQVAKTTILENIIAHRIARNPGPMLGVFGTDRQATTFSKDRLGPMIRDTPELLALVQNKRTGRIGSGSSEILEKKFRSGFFAMTGANSAVGLSMRPVRDLLGDEVDRWPVTAGGRGGDEGDPMALAKKRTSNFSDSLEAWTSSPGQKSTSRIWPRYLATDRCRWLVPCPECGHEQVLAWAGVKFPPGVSEAGDPVSKEERAAAARYECEDCGGLWDDGQRWDAGAAGRWKAQRPQVKDRRGFHINALVSPWLTLADLVLEWLDAEDDDDLRQVFINTRLAELWDDTGERQDPEELLERCEVYAAPIPAGVLAVTAGCDCQQAPPRIEVTRYGWGISGEAWALDHHVIHGDPAAILDPTNEDSRLDDLTVGATLEREDGAPLKVGATCLDSQGGGWYEEALKWARARRGRNCYAIRGVAGEQVPPWPLRAKAVKRKSLGRAEVYNVGVDSIKATLVRMLEKELPDAWEPGMRAPGFLHFPAEPAFDLEFFNQITGESKRPGRKKGRIFVEWIQNYPRVEGLDCFVYARAALAAIGPNWERLIAVRKRDAERRREEVDAEAEAEHPPDEAAPPAPRKRSKAKGRDDDPRQRTSRRQRGKGRGFVKDY